MMREEDKKIYCSFTDKELTNYEGTIDLSPDFEDQFRVFSFYDLEIIVEDGLDMDSLIENIVNNDPQINDVFPAIKVEVDSPFHDVEFGETGQIIEFDYSSKVVNPFEEIGIGVADELYELMNDIDNDRSPEFEKLEFFELHLKSQFGKYRGMMSIDFSKISNYSDLKEVVYEMALEGFNFDETPEDCLYNVPYKNGIVSGTVKQASLYPDELESYVNDISYLVIKNKEQALDSLMELLAKNGFNLDSEFYDLEASADISLRAYLKRLIDKDENYAGLLKKFLS